MGSQKKRKKPYNTLNVEIPLLHVDHKKVKYFYTLLHMFFVVH
jgi:hypothetical protein